MVLHDFAGVDMYDGNTPLLIFDAEEINAIRAMLLRSDWRCEVTDRMREFLEIPEVIKYLESK